MNLETRNLNMNSSDEILAPATPGLPVSKPPAKASRRSRYLLLGGVAAALLAGLAAGLAPRLRSQTHLLTAAREVVHPTVIVTNVTRISRSLELALPGDVRAYEETKIYARADGYLMKWHTDIGAKVTAGQLLAEIDTPDLDQELNQSRAALVQAQANLTLARSSAERWQGLLKARAVSQQEVDEKAGALAAREADVQAAQAAVLRFTKLADFKEVRAPFAGTITGRFVDTGALIRAGSSASSLFQLAQTDTLRVQVNVPQAYLRDINSGAPAQIHVAEYPDRTFSGKVLRTSGAFDPATRTLLTEIEVPNQDGALLPGIHVDVEFASPQADPPLVIPATAVLIRGNGIHVALVDDTQTIRMQKVLLGRDFGKSMEILGGLSNGARIVANPTDTLADGMKVNIAGTPSSAGPNNHLARR